MPSEQADKNGGAPLPPTNQVFIAHTVADETLREATRRVHQIEQESAARSKEWERAVAELATIRDETDTDEVWSEVLRNLNAQFGGSD